MWWKPTDRYTKVREIAPQKAGTYTYTMSMWDPRGQVSISRPSNWTKNQFFKSPNLAEVPFFDPLGHTRISKWKLKSVPPPPQLDHSWFKTQACLGQACDVINPRKNPTHNFCKTVGSNDSFTLSWTVMTVNSFKFKCLNIMTVKRKTSLTVMNCHLNSR